MRDGTREGGAEILFILLLARSWFSPKGMFNVRNWVHAAAAPPATTIATMMGPPVGLTGGAMGILLCGVRVVKGCCVRALRAPWNDVAECVCVPSPVQFILLVVSSLEVIWVVSRVQSNTRNHPSIL